MNRLDLDIRLDRGAFRLEIRESLSLAGTTAIFGANGSGKTSLLRVIAGLEARASGSIRYRSQEWLGPGGSLDPESREVGYVFQDGRLFAHLNVRRNLEFPQRHGRRRSTLSLTDLIEPLGLAGLLERSPLALSGGERQRAAIGRALLAARSMLLMDEPLSSLDQASRRELLPLIKSLPGRFELPILYVTHDLDELVYLADSVMLLADGRNIALGTAQEILARSDFGRLTRLEEPGSVLVGTISGQKDGLTSVSMQCGELRIPQIAGVSGDQVQLRIHARDVILALSPPVGISIRNCLDATVNRLQDSDHQVLVDLDLGGQALRARITQDAARELGLASGMQIHALIKTVAVDNLPRRSQ